MSDAPLNYGQMMQHALKGLMSDALGYVAEHGLPGDHHFYITFYTNDPGVEIPDWLLEQYPEELTIVIQYEFSELAVIKERFTIQLSFNNQLAKLVIPFDAVKTFADPSAEFGLRFDPQISNTDDNKANLSNNHTTDDGTDTGVKKLNQQTPKKKKSAPAKNKTNDTAEVVSLDSFRK